MTSAQNPKSEMRVLFSLSNVWVLINPEAKLFLASDHKIPDVPDYFHRGVVIGKANGKKVILNHFYYNITDADRGNRINATVELVIKPVNGRTFLHLDIKKMPGESQIEFSILPSESDRSGATNVFSIAQFKAKSIFFKKVGPTAIKPVTSEEDSLYPEVEEEKTAVEDTPPVVVAEETMSLEIEESELFGQPDSATTIISPAPVETTASGLNVAALNAPTDALARERSTRIIEGSTKISIDIKSGCVVMVPAIGNKSFNEVIVKIAGKEESFYCFENGNALPFLFPIDISSGKNVMKAQTVVIKNGKLENKFIQFTHYNIPGNAREIYRVNNHGSEIFEKIVN